MGCAGSRQEGGLDATRASGGTRRLKRSKSSKVIEQLFIDQGKERHLVDGETFIWQGQVSESAFYIRTGYVKLMLKSETGHESHLATRGPGDVLGELALLLGHESTVSAVADGPVVCIEVLQTQLIAQLKADPGQSGRLFKAMAIALAERISELSGKLRAQVTSDSTSAQGKGQTSQQLLPAAEISKTRVQFGLPADEKLMSYYQCSVRAENKGVLESQANVGDMFLFAKHLCFDIKVFAFHKQFVIECKDIAGLLRHDAMHNTVHVQLKGSSYEVTIDHGIEEAMLVLEAARIQALAAEISKDATHGAAASGSAALDEFDEMFEPMVLQEARAQNHRAIDFSLTEDDWVHFLAGAKQRSYKKGEYVLREGQPTAALFQIIKGSVRVELQIKDTAQAVMVGLRRAGDMFGETSLLKSGVATASIAADEDTLLVCLEGQYLEELFQSSPGLPGRFFCFIAAYQADRLYQMTHAAAESKAPTVTTSAIRVPVQQIFDSKAFNGLLRKYLLSVQEDKARGNVTHDEADHPINVALGSFDLVVREIEFRKLPDAHVLIKEAKLIADKHVWDTSAPLYLPYLPQQMREELAHQIAALKAGTIMNAQARRMFGEMATLAAAYIESHWYARFLGSEHYNYIVAMKAKEGIVPKLEQFQVIRVLGEGGFGQVIEVIKRDCGVRYAMKVMKKESMKQALGQSWRKKIAMEANLLSAMQHPFLVNLRYAFQNPEFLCLVMDLVPSGDLSEFVLTPRRLTADQARWVIMETVEVFCYMHSQKILYRDLKPENLLVDEAGHVRLIDMGLAVRWTGDRPRRTSRVGTDCYMAPEVRWARKNREAYGTSVDWYTVGVLLYEFLNGALPFSNRDQSRPTYRPGNFPSYECQDFCEKLLTQDWHSRLGCGSAGPDEIKRHPYFKGIDWDIVPSCTLPSPLKGVKGVPKRKKDKELLALRTAQTMHDADLKQNADSDEDVVHTWDFVSPTAIEEEYLESMYRCVSTI